jgi:hypothetical protein
MPTHTSIMHSTRNNSILSAMLAAVIGVGAAHAQNTGAFVNFESPQVHPLDITPAVRDGVVNGGDLAALLAGWGAAGITDIDGNGTTGASDLAILLGDWGACP